MANIVNRFTFAINKCNKTRVKKKQLFKDTALYYEYNIFSISSRSDRKLLSKS